MTLSDFNLAFQNQLAAPFSPMPSAHDIAVEIVRRDQRHIRFLAVLCLLLWLVGGAGVGVLMVGLNQFVLGVRLSNTLEYMALKSQAQGVSPAPQTADNSDGSQQKIDQAQQTMLSDGTDLFHHSLPYIDGALGCLLLAALCTVWLVFASRRTTLNRINISLAQIAEQLRQLAKPTGQR
jgi:predicted PurR-regulated permease PerM